MVASGQHLGTTFPGQGWRRAHVDVGRSEKWLPHSEIKTGEPPAGHLRGLCEIFLEQKGLGFHLGGGKEGAEEARRGGGLRQTHLPRPVFASPWAKLRGHGHLGSYLCSLLPRLGPVLGPQTFPKLVRILEAFSSLQHLE